MTIQELKNILRHKLNLLYITFNYDRLYDSPYSTNLKLLKKEILKTKLKLYLLEA